jgi:hypothetical protein
LQAHGIQPDLLCTVTADIAREPFAVYQALRDLKTGWIQFIPLSVAKPRRGHGRFCHAVPMVIFFVLFTMNGFITISVSSMFSFSPKPQGSGPANSQRSAGCRRPAAAYWF